MTELEKLEAGLEYCYDDPEVEARKEQAIIWCREYNAIDGSLLPDSDIVNNVHISRCLFFRFGDVFRNVACL